MLVIKTITRMRMNDFGDTEFNASGELLTTCLLKGYSVGIWDSEHSFWVFGFITGIKLESGIFSELGYAHQFMVKIAGYDKELYVRTA